MLFFRRKIIAFLWFKQRMQKENPFLCSFFCVFRRKELSLWRLTSTLCGLPSMNIQEAINHIKNL